MFELVAGERRVPELCGGPGSISDSGEPGSGWGNGRLRTMVDAHDRSRLRDCDRGGAAGAYAYGFKPRGAGSALRFAHDRAHRGVATCCQSQNGGAADADGIDPGDGCG